MTARAIRPDKSDIQGLVVYGYSLDCSRHFVLRVKHVYKARRFLGELVKQRLITDASTRSGDVQLMNNRGPSALNVGITYRGLEKLGLPARYLHVFRQKARAFAEGAYPRAARRLADTGPSAAQLWDRRFKPERAHVLLSVYADKGVDWQEVTARLKRVRGAYGLLGWDHPFDAEHLTTEKEGRREHFGFRDGISQPAVRGFHKEKEKQKLHEPGEFLLGYNNDENFNPWMLPFPHLLPWLLPVQPDDHPDFFRNGSFGVFRKMQQDVEGFNASVGNWADKLAGRHNIKNGPEYVKAKLCGRWSDGSVVTAASPSAPYLAPNPGVKVADEALNAFDFSDDEEGLGCPYGAHIRRMNPRADKVVPFRKRPLLRRGMPYGPKFVPGSENERGLLGLFFCASLEDQFEHLLAEWGDQNPMGPDNRGNAKDPLVGNHEDSKAVFDIPVEGEDLRQLDGFKPYVTTRGTLYAFYPGIKALGQISVMSKPAS
jgi:Dyp-type peroxidase family